MQHPGRRRGSSLVEFSLILPWYIFLFIGVLDMGYYCCALIAVQGAARIACVYTSGSTAKSTDSTTACTYALAQLRNLPNVPTSITTCSAAPVTVTATKVASGPDGAAAAKVVVTYVPPGFASIPGILAGQVTITRTVQMKL